MSEKSDHGGDRPPTQSDEPNRTGDESAPTQHDGAQNNATEADKIDRGHPPRDTRFQKGQPSPNPKGRPRKGQSMIPDLKELFEQALNKKVRVSRGDKKVLMTKLELSFEQQLNQAVKGDRHALRLLMDIAPKVGVDFQAKHKQILEEALAPSYQAILDDFLARRSGANVASTTVDLAPPELLDDDHAEAAPPSEATAAPHARAAANTAPAPTSAAPPPAKTKPASTPGTASPAEAKPAATLAAAPRKPAASAATPPPEITGHVLGPRGWTPAKIGSAPSEAKTASAREPTPAKDNSAPRLEPPLKPGVKYPKPFREMTHHAKWVWFPDWCAKHPDLCAEPPKFDGGKR